MEQTAGLLTDYPTLDESARGNLIAASLDFMRALAECSSPQSAEAAWNAIADRVHPDLKYDILMSLLNNETGQTIMLHDCGENFITCIKLVRHYTGKWLADAKHLCDLVRSGASQRIRVSNWRQRNQCLKDFTDNCCRVS